MRTIVVEKRPIDEQASLTGQIRAQDEVNLSFRIDGKLIERPINVGDRVEAGTLIGRLDPQNEQNALRSAQADVAAARALLSQVKADEARQKELLDKGFTTRVRYDDALQKLQTAQAQVESAEARLHNAEDRVTFTELRADAPGVVTGKGAEPGEVVRAGQMIVQIARQGGKDAVFDVPALLLRQAPRSPVVEVYLADNPGIRCTGRVREISPQADPTLRTHQVKIGLIDPPRSMFLGATVVGRIVRSVEVAVQLPATSLTRTDGKPAVWVVDKAANTVSLRPVEIARYDENTIVVSQGLNDGEIVVTAGAQALRPGQKVKLLGAAS